MEIVVGGKKYPVSDLHLADVARLSKSGALVRMSKLTELELWQQLETTADVLAVAARRAGADITAEKLLDDARPDELAGLMSALPEIMAASGFATGDASPNAGSPETASTLIESSGG